MLVQPLTMCLLHVAWVDVRWTAVCWLWGKFVFHLHGKYAEVVMKHCVYIVGIMGNYLWAWIIYSFLEKAIVSWKVCAFQRLKPVLWWLTLLCANVFLVKHLLRSALWCCLLCLSHSVCVSCCPCPALFHRLSVLTDRRHFLVMSIDDDTEWLSVKDRVCPSNTSVVCGSLAFVLTVVSCSVN